MRKTRIAATLACALAFVLALVGCSSGPTDADVIRQGIDEELSSIKSGDDELVSAVAEGAGEDLDQLGIDSAQFLSAYLDGFDYSIGDINVDGNTATVHLSVTCRSMNGIVSDFESKFTEALTEADDVTDEDALYKLAGEVLMQCVADAPLKTSECDVTCEKDSDGSWSYADGVQEQVSELFVS